MNAADAYLNFDVFFVVYFIRKQMRENKELVMVGLLIDSLRNLNPPFRQRRHMVGDS